MSDDVELDVLGNIVRELQRLPDAATVWRVIRYVTVRAEAIADNLGRTPAPSEGT